MTEEDTTTKEKALSEYGWYELVEYSLQIYEMYLKESDNEMALDDLEHLFLIREKIALLIQQTKQWILTDDTQA